MSDTAMSDAVAWDLVTAPARMPSRTARSQLRLVGPDGPVRPDRLLGPGKRLGAGAEKCAEVVELACRSPLPTMRFTRRGPLVLTIMTGVIVVTLAVGLASAVDAAAPQINHATTVSAGQTLSEVAAAQLPSLPINDAVARIQLVNGLNTSQVHAGQSLLIPAMP